MNFFKPVSYVISAPSGAGKTSIIKEAQKLLPSITWAISHTTRNARAQEQDGVDYFFISQQEFKKQRNENAFIEWAEVHSNYYGTSFSQIKKAKEEKITLILDIDIQGAIQLQKQKIDNLFFIFVKPPSLQTLRNRLIARNTETEESLAIRLAGAEKELTFENRYDFVVINDELEKATKDFVTYVLQTSIIWQDICQLRAVEVANSLYTNLRKTEIIPSELQQLIGIIDDLYKKNGLV